jgi:ribosomal protein S18 acetylase RimI-like enzyme
VENSTVTSVDASRSDPNDHGGAATVAPREEPMVSASLRRPAAIGRVLRDGSIPARVRTWPFDPSVGQLVVYRARIAPTHHDVATWVAQLDPDFPTVRTGALPTANAEPFLHAGFREVQRLALLEHRSPASAGAAAQRGRTRRIRSSELGAAEAVDRAAFDPPWQLDAAAIDDACRATTHHRARLTRTDGIISGYAVTGRDGVDGYLQRLAVRPEHQGRGLATALVLDALKWAGSQGAHRVLVNTHVGNSRALALYRRLGFTDLDDQLVVLERSRP